MNTTVTNITVTGLRGVTGTSLIDGGIKSAAFYATAAGVGSGDVANVNMTVQNSLFANNLNDGVSNNCSAADITSVVGGTGTGIATITSLGHNISDDATCTSFTQPGDKQNVNNIISTLGPLQNNGGNVPTRALLAGSPAISAGSAVLGVTTDARGVARPEACPSVGAFQFEGAVCGVSTPSGSNGGGNAGAPNTGIGSASLVQLVAGLSGVSLLVVLALRRRTSL